MLEILEVEPGSIGAELDLDPGDCLLAINGEVIRDLLDYQLQEATEDLLLEVRKKDGTIWEVEIEKDAPDSMGLHFEHPVPKQCGNNCLFCFVHQLPPGMRSSLYVKDEDFRFSYLYGSYVTLTNISEEEIRRILDQRLSPLYVSVHATEEQLRTRLLGRSGPPILELIERLTAGGIEIHTQIVLCPGVNDGADLRRTVEDLHALHPGVASLAVVPVGLTGYRSRLPDLRPPTEVEAREVLDVLHGYQERFLRESGTRFVFAADEFYLKAGVEFPPLEAYENLAQLENGVGMISQFRAEAAEVMDEAEPIDAPPVAIMTGQSALPELERFARELERHTGVIIKVYGVRNRFFGGHVTVTGLLTGGDIVEQLRGRSLGDVLLIPDVMLKAEEDIFLDDLSLHQLEEALSVRIEKVESSPWGLLEAIEKLSR